MTDSTSMRTVVVVSSGSFEMMRRRRRYLLARFREEYERTVVVCGDSGLRGKSDEVDEVVVAQLDRSRILSVSDIIGARQIWRVLRREKPAVVFAYTTKAALICGVICASMGIRYVPMITGLGRYFDEWSTSVIRQVAGRVVYRFALRSARYVIFQNAEDMELFISNRMVEASRARLIAGSGVDIEEFSWHPLPDVPAVCMLSRIVPDKGVEDYIHAARLVRTRYSDTRFFLAGAIDTGGGGWNYDEIVSLCGRDVKYIGELADVRPLLARSTMAVLGSRNREGVPRAVLEAHAFGRPVVATDVPGTRSVVVDGFNGFLVPPQSPAELAEKIEVLISDRDMAAALGLQARRHVESRFSDRLVVDDILRLC